jgi:hypothetical protein
MVAPDRAEPCNIIAPVSMKLRGNGGPVNQLAARLGHTLMGRLPRMLGKRPRSVGGDEDVVSLLNQAERWERNADLSQDTAAINMLGRVQSIENFVGLGYLMTTCFLPVFLTACAKSWLSIALISPGRRITVASGSVS